MESRERADAALRRELEEELGIDAGSMTEIARYEHAYDDFAVDLRFYRVDEFRGEIQNLAFRELKWAAAEDLQELDFLDGDWPLVRLLSSAAGRPVWPSHEE